MNNQIKRLALLIFVFVGITQIGNAQCYTFTCDYDFIVANFGNSTVTQYNSTSNTYVSTPINSNISAPNAMLLHNGILYIANGGGATISMFDEATMTFQGTFANQGMAFPEQMTIGHDGNLYVANRDNDSITYYDINTGALLGTFANLLDATGLVYDPITNLYYASSDEPGGVVNAYDTSGNLVQTIHTYGAGEFPRGLAIGPDGRLYVIVAGTATIHAIDLATNTDVVFTTLDSGSNPFQGLTWGPDGTMYVADYGESEVHLIDPSGNMIATITDQLNGPHYVQFLTPPNALSCSTTTTNTCSGSSGGQVIATAQNTNGVTQFSIDNGATWQSSGTFSGLTPGIYTVLVQDESCTSCCQGEVLATDNPPSCGTINVATN